MQHLPYRLFRPFTWITLGVAVFCFLAGCTKENKPAAPPVIRFVQDSGYQWNDTTLIVGDRVRIGIKVTACGSNITFFQVSFNNGKRQILLDSGLNHNELTYNLNIIKSAGTAETWTFVVMDRNRNLDSISILLRKSDSSHYGRIRQYDNILVGAQASTMAGSFLTFTGGRVLGLDSAFANQSLTDLIYYFGQYDATLSSPNETEAPSYFTGPSGIANWTIKNETRYDTTLLTAEQFDRAGNDSLLLAVYEPAAGKRKTKFVVPGMVISLKNAAGKIGLIKVTGYEPGVTGTLNFSVKIQE